jgi:predicted phage terminase large subunit-like protein
MLMERITPAQAATELLRRRRSRANLVDYARFIDVPGAPVNEEDDEGDAPDAIFQPVETQLAEHHEIILNATQRCIERHRGRTMLFLPPGSAKSTYATVVAPTWAMGRQRDFKVIGVSYGSDLTRKFGRRMRSIAKQPKFRLLFDTALSTESSAADEWALENGSEFMGGGILSGITGNRADFIPIDDPTKGRREAGSEATQKSTMEAYQDDVLTRLKPSGSLMLTQTRWDMMDLAGQILPENWNGESGMIECRDGETWEVICIPAKAERHDDPLGRLPGEYLWPEYFGEDHWKPFERIPRTWSALYQQRPSPETGDYFKREWIIPVETTPPKEEMSIYGGSDYAVTADGGDFTVHAVIGISHDGRTYLLDLWRQQASSDAWVDAFCALVRKWKPIGWAEEHGQIKSGVGPFLVKRMLETGSYTVRESFPTRGDKAVRAQSIRGRMAMQGLCVPRDAPWLADFIAELMSFPVGVHDDQVDALGLVGQLLDRMMAGEGPKDSKPRLSGNAPRVIAEGVVAPPLRMGRR